MTSGVSADRVRRAIDRHAPRPMARFGLAVRGPTWWTARPWALVAKGRDIWLVPLSMSHHRLSTW